MLADCHNRKAYEKALRDRANTWTQQCLEGGRVIGQQWHAIRLDRVPKAFTIHNGQIRQARRRFKQENGVKLKVIRPLR